MLVKSACFVLSRALPCNTPRLLSAQLFRASICYFTKQCLSLPRCHLSRFLQPLGCSNVIMPVTCWQADNRRNSQKFHTLSSIWFFSNGDKSQKNEQGKKRQDITIDERQAMEEFLLEQRHLATLRNTVERSSYGNRSITKYFRSDVVTRAIEIHGSIEALEKRKKFVGYYDDESSHPLLKSRKESMKNPFWRIIVSPSGKVVMAAIFANVLNAGFKGYAWLKTGSNALFAEMIHSLADAMNQVFLLIGLWQSNKVPDSDHPYGFGTVRYIFSLVAGLGIFFIGGGINIYHGVLGLLYEEECHKTVWALYVLAATTVTELGSLWYAYSDIRVEKSKRKEGLWEYIQNGRDPNVTLVFLEDTAAVLGNLIAFVCYGMTCYTKYTSVDPIGSLLIGGLLVGVSAMIIVTNFENIAGKSLPAHYRRNVIQTMERDEKIRSVQDVKLVNVGGSQRLKAEIEYDGRKITEAYLNELDMEVVFKETQELKTPEEAKEFLIHHGGNVIDRLGKEVDRIEKNIKAEHKDIRHVDLESL